MGAAGLEGYKQGGTARIAFARPGVIEGFNLSMWGTCLAVPAAADDPAVFDEHGPHHWIWGGQASAAPGQTQGGPHPTLVHSLNSAAANCAASKGWRSSACSPNPINFTGSPSSFWMATTIPPLLVPSSLVTTKPVSGTAL